MVKVVLPLGSESARGQLGKSIIFQGSTAKVYRAPVIQKGEGQRAAERRFRDVNKTIRAARPWARRSFESMFGRNWLAFCYKALVSYWDDLAVEFTALGSGDQETWADYAPIQNTVIDAGLVWYVCAWGLKQHMTDNGLFEYEYFEVGDVNAVGAREWWDRELTGVFGAGKYDQSNADIQFSAVSGAWTEVTGALAYGGSYQASGMASFSLFKFWFYGTRFAIIYKQAAAFSIMHLDVDVSTYFEFSQNDIATVYQAQWTSPAMPKGLHKVVGYRTGAEGPINVDGILIYA